MTISYSKKEQDRNKTNKGNHVYMGLGYNMTSILGPSMNLGVNLNWHLVEMGVVNGSFLSDDIYIYNSQGSVEACYKYNVIRAQLRYGYEVRPFHFFHVIPMVGGAFNFIQGTKSLVGSKEWERLANSFSGFGALRLAAVINQHLQLQVTPEYDFYIKRSVNNWYISRADHTINSWTEGFNLNLGLVYSF